MAASAFMPTITVEIAFNAGYSTPVGSRTWTDVSAYVEAQDAISITRGRSDELSDVSPSTCTVTLDNKDGRFTPEYASGAYYPNVKKGRPIRVTAVWPLGGGGDTYRRFTGYIDEWPVVWPDPGAGMATVTITATSRQARLGRTAPFSNVLAQEILQDAPAAYWPLGDPEGSTLAAQVSGSNFPPLSALSHSNSTGTLTFGAGVGPATDGLSAVVIAGHSALDCVEGRIRWLGTPTGFPQALCTDATGHLAIEMWFATTTQTGGLFGLGNNISYIVGDMFVGDLIIQQNAGSLTSYTATAVNDGLLHHLVVKISPNGVNFDTEMMFDGVLVDTDIAGVTINQLTSLGAAGNVFNLNRWTLNYGLTGTYAQVALYNTDVSIARFQEHYLAGTTGFAGDSSDEWFERIVAWSDIDDYGFETGESQSLGAIDPTDKTPMEMFNLIADAEGGVMFDAGDGSLEFQSRSHRFGVSTPGALTLSAATQQIQADLAAKLDDQGLANDVTASGVGGLSSTRAINQDSIDDHGYYKESAETVLTDPYEIEDYANRRVNAYGEPSVRVPQVTVQLMGLSSATITSLLALEIGTKIQLSGLPTQAPATAIDFFIEGYSESIGFESWTITFNLSPADLAGVNDVFVIEHAIYGLVGLHPIA